MLANVFTIMIILLGLGSLYQMKRDLFPNVDFGETVIVTRYPGASPEDVELNVTNEIEEELRTISDIDKITSYSMEDMSFITVTVDVNASDKEKTKADIREAVTRVTNLPEEVTESPLVTEISTEIIPIIEVGIAGNLSYEELREAAKLFKKDLENVPGVSSVQEFWYLDPEVRIEISPEKVEEYQIPLEEISRAIRLRNIRSTGGTFESFTSEKNLVTLAQFKDPKEVEDVIVRSSFDGPALRISDLGEVRMTFEEPRIISRINGVPAIAFSVLKQKSADIIRTSSAIKKFIEKEKEFLPDGVQVLITNDSSLTVRNRFGVVLTNGAIGLALVLILLTVFLEPRTAFWVALSIPVTLMGVVFLMPVAGAYLDVIALTAMLIVIGIIVDDGIIVSENIVSKAEQGFPPLQAATEGIQQVFKPVLTTMLTTFLAFAPMFFMSGVTGTFVFIIPLVISLALLVSLFEVIIALPAHLLHGLGKIKRKQTEGGHWFDPIRKIFRSIIFQILRFRYPFILLSIVLFVGSVWFAVTNMQFILFPNTAADTFDIYVDLPVGSSLQMTSEKIREIERIIEDLPDEEVASFSAKIGTHGEREPGERDNWATITVNLVPYARRDRTASEIVENLREKTDSLSGYQKINFAIQAGGPPVGDPITIRVVGSDDEIRRALTDSIITYMDGIEGVRDIDRNDKLGKDQISLDIDYAALSRLGLTVSDVARTVRIAYDGELVTSARLGDEDVFFRLTFPPRVQDEMDMLSELRVANNQGRLIRLGQVADFDIQPGPANYYHFDGDRTTTVTADVIPRTATPVGVTTEVLQHFNLDKDWPGMRLVIGGEAEETASSFQSLYIAFGIAVIAIYFVLILLFNSFSQPFLVMVAIPFGIIGVVIAFALHGQPLGFLALMGLVGLGGVAVNDSLVMVSHINDLMMNKKDESNLCIIANGVADRLRAIIMTTLTTVVGLIPLVYGIGGSDPFIAPMALALGYGLLFATPLTIIFVPCLYAVRMDINSLFARIFRKRQST